jgi:hypothetical protein
MIIIVNAHSTIKAFIASPTDEQTMPAIAMPFDIPTAFVFLREDIPRHSPIIPRTNPIK